MSAGPLVSVVVPTHNRHRLLRGALASIAAQTLVGEIEIIVIDDASTPMVGLTPAEIDQGVHLIRQTDSMGPSVARNRGLAAARGQWVAFLDDDDRWRPELLETMLAASAEQERQWVVCGLTHIDESGRQAGTPRSPGADAGAALATDDVLETTSALLAERSLLWEHGGFSASLGALGGWELALRLAAAGPPAVVEQPLVERRRHPAQLRRDVRRTLHERRAITARHGDGQPLGRDRFWESLAGSAPPVQRPWWQLVRAWRERR